MYSLTYEPTARDGCQLLAWGLIQVDALQILTVRVRSQTQTAMFTYIDTLAMVESHSAYQVPKARHSVAMLAPNPALLNASHTPDRAG